MDEQRAVESQGIRMQRIRRLDVEELQVEEVDDDYHSDDEGGDHASYREDCSRPCDRFTFNTSLASRHTYLGEVDDTHGRTISLDGGVILTLPLLYLKGVVLFPEAILPLRVIEPALKASVERALNQADAPYTIAVIHVLSQLEGGMLHRFGTIGTTAEIRQYKRLHDGSLNVVARGQQRYHLRRCWMDVEGAPCAEVQIIEEDAPVRTPKDAFAQLASVVNPSSSHGLLHVLPQDNSLAKHQYADKQIDLEGASDMGPVSDRSVKDTSLQASIIDSSNECGRFDFSTSNEEDAKYEQKQRKCSFPVKQFSKGEGQKWRCAANESKWSYRAPLSFWPHWVYQMYDSFFLAQRAADMWKRIIGAPKMDDLVKKPDILSFRIASKLPLSEDTRQELLEIHGVSYRLRKEIELLACFNHVRCKICQTLIGKRSDVVVMSSDGPLNAYANPHGYVHEIMTLNRASGLALQGLPETEHTWFPGYAWTITNCAICGSNIGWLFTATRKRLQPKSFWGIRSSQVVDDASS